MNQKRSAAKGRDHQSTLPTGGDGRALTAAQSAAAVHGGRLSASELVEDALRRIDLVNGSVNAFATGVR